LTAASPPSETLIGVFAEARLGEFRFAVELIAVGELLAGAWMLSDAERRRASAIRAQHAARLYTAAHVLRRQIVGRHLAQAPKTVRFGPFRAPLRDGSFVSLSHTRGAVAVAIADAPVGVDIERTDRTVDVDRLAARTFAPAEIQRLGALTPSARKTPFAELWTAKEALMKATGLTLRAALALEVPANLHVSGTARVGDVALALSRPTDDLACALALAPRRRGRRTGRT
jgi:phosphopantetheine--protein transferase-like protein